VVQRLRGNFPPSEAGWGPPLRGQSHRSGVAEELPASSIDAEFHELEVGRHVPPDRV
jgi:hypothetical protein